MSVTPPSRAYWRGAATLGESAALAKQFRDIMAAAAIDGVRCEWGRRYGVTLSNKTCTLESVGMPGSRTESGPQAASLDPVVLARATGGTYNCSKFTSVQTRVSLDPRLDPRQEGRGLDRLDPDLAASWATSSVRTLSCFSTGRAVVPGRTEEIEALLYQRMMLARVAAASDTAPRPGGVRLDNVVITFRAPWGVDLDALSMAYPQSSAWTMLTFPAVRFRVAQQAMHIDMGVPMERLDECPEMCITVFSNGKANVTGSPCVGLELALAVLFVENILSQFSVSLERATELDRARQLQRLALKAGRSHP